MVQGPHGDRPISSYSSTIVLYLMSTGKYLVTCHFQRTHPKIGCQTFRTICFHSTPGDACGLWSRSYHYSQERSNITCLCHGSGTDNKKYVYEESISLSFFAVPSLLEKKTTHTHPETPRSTPVSAYLAMVCDDAPHHYRRSQRDNFDT